MKYQWKLALFAGLQERIGSNIVLIPSDKDELTVSELKTLISTLYPEQAALLHISFIARNHAYATENQLLHINDELAMLPPVSGGEDEVHHSTIANNDQRYEITDKVIHADDVLAKVIIKEHGASLAFVGTTREWTEGVQTVHLEYEAYTPMAIAMMQQIGDEIAEQWSGALCAISHRIGVVDLAETSVIIAVSAPHRDACYEASRYAIERLKQIVPIWKKEIWSDGSEWKGSQHWNPTMPLTE
ncbi:molybdenum cofactor biosynthesis protein MoaE [Paenibacillus sp. GSMTC-2017]|uniref:molybdenum cofactor biosynthesis protein n=1 Tax=Paenibacillus sp. GSMTC-2017 TaxID=2794350 RepID=UPI0018D9D4DB|nr:molybdenum cofactor biosynthesis protein MoaE [Paenibacillus sp. GSMTC-2017]MBH5318531.1 molybdenum cofactor biosynthesis protein MoaE [Paenibacillus sp. GSMTC-2017]